MDQKKTDRRRVVLKLYGNKQKRYKQIRNYRDRYGISPFEDEKLQERSPQLYRALKKMLNPHHEE